MKDPSQRSLFVGLSEASTAKAAYVNPNRRNKTGGQPRHAVTNGTSNMLQTAVVFAA